MTVQLAAGSVLSWCIALTEAAKGSSIFGLGLQSSPDPDFTGEEAQFIPSEEEAVADSQTQRTSDKGKEQHWYTQKPRNGKECSKSQSAEKLKPWLWGQQGIQTGPELRAQPSDSNEQVLIRRDPNQA